MQVPQPSPDALAAAQGLREQIAEQSTALQQLLQQVSKAIGMPDEMWHLAPGLARVILHSGSGNDASSE